MLNHNFKKKFGQNFISDKNLLSAICNDADIKAGDYVLEIGAGGGTLTKEIASRAKKVVSYEIDKDLKPYLLSLDLPNTEFVFEDVLSDSVADIEKKIGGNYKLVANLPYYITSPIIFKFLKEGNLLTSLTIMVQKEVAQRIVAQKDSRDYGVLSIMTAFYGNATIKRIVSKNMFYPKPDVDSALVTINIDKKKNENINGEDFYNFLCKVFAMRRKTLKNNLLHASLTAEKIDKLDEITLKKRPENLSLDQLISIYLNIFK